VEGGADERDLAKGKTDGNRKKKEKVTKKTHYVTTRWRPRRNSGFAKKSDSLRVGKKVGPPGGRVMVRGGGHRRKEGILETGRGKNKMEEVKVRDRPGNNFKKKKQQNSPEFGLLGPLMRGPRTATPKKTSLSGPNSPLRNQWKNNIGNTAGKKGKTCY